MDDKDVSVFSGCEIVVGKSSDPLLQVQLVLSPDRVSELRTVLARGLNTWDKMPKWLCTLDAMLAAKEEGL